MLDLKLNVAPNDAPGIHSIRQEERKAVFGEAAEDKGKTGQIKINIICRKQLPVSWKIHRSIA